MNAAVVPGALILGAAKSGTTSLYSYLGQHPDVHAPDTKEPRFFAIEGSLAPELQGVHWLRDTWERYVDLYRDARPGQCCVDGSVAYLHSAGAVERVKARAPDVPFVVLLRHPVEATWSHYLMARRDGQTRLTLDQLVDREPLEPIAPVWDIRPTAIVRSRLYHAHLSRWLAAFPREQLLVHLYEDLRTDPEGVVRRTFAHVGVDPEVPLDLTTRLNVGSDPRSMRLHAFDERPGRVGHLVKGALRHVPGRRAVQDAVNRWNRRPPPALPSSLRARLLAIFRDDTERLERMLDRDLSAWKR